MPGNQPPEKQVDCACDAALQLPVLLDQTGLNQRVTACLSCGRLDYVECLIDEPRPNDVRCAGNIVLPLDPPLRDWLEQWPRRHDRWHGERQYAFFPAALRRQDAGEFPTYREQVYAEQHGISYRDRLLKAGFPSAPPPPGLPARWKASPASGPA